MNQSPGAELKSGTPSVSPVRLFLRRIVVQLLRLRVWITETGPGDLWESSYFWAVIVGLCGAFSSVGFREALYQLQWLLLGYQGPLEGAASTLPWWGRLLMPTVGSGFAVADRASGGIDRAAVCEQLDGGVDADLAAPTRKTQAGFGSEQPR